MGRYFRMKLRQKLKKQKKQNSQQKEQKQLLLLDGALKKLVDYKISVIDDNKYKYSPQFERTAQNIISSPPSKINQMSLGREARRLIPQILVEASYKTTRRDIENMITAYVCLKTHIQEQHLEVDKKIIPDLAYAVWYLNDNNPTIDEVESWSSHNEEGSEK